MTLTQVPISGSNRINTGEAGPDLLESGDAGALKFRRIVYDEQGREVETTKRIITDPVDSLYQFDLDPLSGGEEMTNHDAHETDPISRDTAHKVGAVPAHESFEIHTARK